MEIRKAKSKDLAKIEALDALCYPKELRSTLHNLQMRYFYDKDSIILAVDQDDNVLGYLNYLRISKFLYHTMLAVNDKRFFGDAVETRYLDKHSDLLLLKSVVVHPEHRDSDIIHFLTNEFKKELTGKKALSEVTTEDGRKVVERLNFIPHKPLGNGYKLYRYPNKF